MYIIYSMIKHLVGESAIINYSLNFEVTTAVALINFLVLLARLP